MKRVVWVALVGWMVLATAGVPGVRARAVCLYTCAATPPTDPPTAAPVGGGNGLGGADNNPRQTALAGADAGAANTASDQPDGAGSGQNLAAQQVTPGGQGQNCLVVGQLGCQEAELPCVYTASCTPAGAAPGPAPASGGEGLCVGGFDGYGAACGAQPVPVAPSSAPRRIPPPVVVWRPQLTCGGAIACPLLPPLSAGPGA